MVGDNARGMSDAKYTEWLEAMDRVETALKPIVAEAQKITSLEAWQNRPHPLDAAGVRDLAEKTVLDMVGRYPALPEEGRLALREAVRAFPQFAWCADLPDAPLDPDQLRRWLLWFSIRDLGRDTRDALLELDAICAAASQAGLDPAPALREVAGLSSDVNPHGLGSMKEILMRRAS